MLVRSWVTLLCATSCGPGVQSGQAQGPALLTLRADIVNTDSQSSPSGALGAAVLWAALPPPTESCLAKAGSTEAVARCAGSQFRPSLTSWVVPVEPSFPASIEVNVSDVPPLEALSSTRFGYGLLVVFRDGDANGQLGLVEEQATEGPDEVLGTSLRASSDFEGDYLGYAEGPDAPAWNAFRLLAGCPEAPRGYFIFNIVRDGERYRCQGGRPDRTLTLELAAAPRVRAKVCKSAPVPQAQVAPAEPPLSSAQLRCWGQASVDVVSAPSAVCPRVVRYDLGTGSAPTWWPCFRDGTELQLEPAHMPMTEDVDRLFTVRFVRGTGAFRLVDLRIKVGTLVLKTADPRVILGRPNFENDDRDHDGKFSVGDTLTVQEDHGGRFSTSPGPLPVEVSAESDGRVVGLGRALTWVP